jgi:general secretion pathway protein G
VGDDIADSAGSDDEDFVHGLGDGQGVGEIRGAGKAEDTASSPRKTGDNFCIAWRCLPCEALAGRKTILSSMKIHQPTTKIRRRAGFTLLEMVIVLGIIAMIMGGAIFAMRKVSGGAKLTQADSDFKSLQSALAMYKLNAGHLPTTQQGLKALVDKPSSAPAPRRWTRLIDKVPLDPWGNEYIYRFPGKKNPSDFEIFSKGEDGMENTADDLSSQDE